MTIVKNAQPLFAISPLDGRYSAITSPLSSCFSEYALMKKRVAVEIAYLILLSQQQITRTFSSQEKTYLDTIITNFSLKDAETIKKKEEKYKHDIKAIEYYLRDTLSATTLNDVIQYIHFGLTSEDVNNLSYA